MQGGGGGNCILTLSYVCCPGQRFKARGLLPTDMNVCAQERCVTAGSLHCVEVEHTAFLFKCGHLTVFIRDLLLRTIDRVGEKLYEEPPCRGKIKLYMP